MNYKQGGHSYYLLYRFTYDPINSLKITAQYFIDFHFFIEPVT